MTHWGHGDPNDRAALRRAYIEHYDHVRSKVPKENLLEFQSSQGWKPLCQFLGKQIPNEEYPRSNDAASTVRIHNFLYWLRIVKLSWKLLVTVGALRVAL